MATIIKPTVGRKVWCFGSMAHYQDYQRGEHEAQPHDGTVIFVHDDRCVNVRVTLHDGRVENVLGLPLVQDGDPEPNGAHARWMPYQTKQQAKADSQASVGTAGETQAIPSTASDPEALGNEGTDAPRIFNNEGDEIGTNGGTPEVSDAKSGVAANPSDSAIDLGSKL